MEEINQRSNSEPMVWSDSEESCSMQEAPADLSMSSGSKAANLSMSSGSKAANLSMSSGSKAADLSLSSGTIKPIEIKPDYSPPMVGAPASTPAEHHALPMTLAR